MKGCIFDIQRCCMDDGPGIRTTVFLKGCNLRCRWCHNPESFLKNPQLTYDGSKCTGCGECVSVCEQNVHVFDKTTHKINFQNCMMCGRCMEKCPSKALGKVGRWMESSEVTRLVLRDKKYYEQSGGGVTFSGGEPTAQYEFLLELLKECKAHGVSTALETNGICEEAKFRKLMEFTDLFLLDFKIADTEKHREYTGAGNEAVYRHLSLLDEAKKEVVLRCPIIPGINDDPAHLKRIKELSEAYPCIRETEIMPYHDTGAGKWPKIGLEYSLKGLKSLTALHKSTIIKSIETSQ